MENKNQRADPFMFKTKIKLKEINTGAILLN